MNPNALYRRTNDSFCLLFLPQSSTVATSHILRTYLYHCRITYLGIVIKSAVMFVSPYYITSVISSLLGNYSIVAALIPFFPSVLTFYFNNKWRVVSNCSRLSPSTLLLHGLPRPSICIRFSQSFWNSLSRNNLFLLNSFFFLASLVLLNIFDFLLDMNTNCYL